MGTSPRSNDLPLDSVSEPSYTPRDFNAQRFSETIRMEPLDNYFARLSDDVIELIISKCTSYIGIVASVSPRFKACSALLITRRKFPIQHFRYNYFGEFCVVSFDIASTDVRVKRHIYPCFRYPTATSYTTTMPGSKVHITGSLFPEGTLWANLSRFEKLEWLNFMHQSFRPDSPSSWNKTMTLHVDKHFPCLISKIRCTLTQQ